MILIAEVHKLACGGFNLADLKPFRILARLATETDFDGRQDAWTRSVLEMGGSSLSAHNINERKQFRKTPYRR